MQENSEQMTLEEIDKLIGNTEGEAQTGLGETVDEVQLQVQQQANKVDTGGAEAAAQSLEDPLTGEIKPLGSEGFSPNTAKNESIVEPLDRVKLAAGNKKGKLSYLKSKFEEAEINDSGDFVVKQGETWYKVDPSGLGTIDDWTNTKQLMKAGKELALDVADVWPEIAAGAAGIGVGVATGGAGFAAMLGAEAAAAGGVAAYRTLLGRVVGTYEASADETARDIGMEGLLATAGVGVLAGVKPGGQWLMKNIPTISKGLRAVNEVPESIGKSVGKYFARNAGVSAQAYETMLNAPGPLKQTVKTMSKKAAEIGGDSREAFWQATQESQLDDIYEFAKGAKKLKGKLYNNFEKKMIKRAGDDFVDPTSRSAISAAMDSVKAGMTKVRVRANANGEAVWQTVDADRAVKILLDKAKSGKPIDPKLIQFQAPNAQELEQLVRANVAPESGLRNLATDPEGVSMLQRLNNDLNLAASTQATRGKRGVRAAMAANRSFRDNIDSVRRMMSEKGATQAAAKIGSINSRFQGAMKNSLDEATEGAFSEFNTKYSMLKQNLDPLEKMYTESPEKSLKAAQTYLGQITSTRNSGILSRKGMREAQAAARDLDPGTASLLSNLQQSIDLKQSALEWNPIAKGKGGTDLAMGTYALGSGNAPLLGALGARAAATSRGVTKVGTKTSQFMWNQLNVLKALDGRTKSAFLNSPVGAAGTSNAAASFFREDILANDPELRETILPTIPLRGDQ